MNQENLPEIEDEPSSGALAPEARARMEAAAPLLHNGTFTVSHEKRGHFTVKVATAQKGELAGKRIIYLLTGPDNVGDYRGVAFWIEDELDSRTGKPWPKAVIWKKYRGSDSRLPLDGYHYQRRVGWSSYEQKIAIFLDLALRELGKEKVWPAASHFAAEGYKIERSSRCVRCNRVLTHPESLKLGVGPECAGK